MFHKRADERMTATGKGTRATPSGVLRHYWRVADGKAWHLAVPIGLTLLASAFEGASFSLLLPLKDAVVENSFDFLAPMARRCGLAAFALVFVKGLFFGANPFPIRVVVDLAYRQCLDRHRPGPKRHGQRRVRDSHRGR